MRGFFAHFFSSGSRWAGYVFALDSPVVIRGFNLLVITLVVWMFVSAHLERRRSMLENELLLFSPHIVSENSAPRIQKNGSVAHHIKEYAGIAARNLFATQKDAQATSGKEEELIIEDMPLASLKLKLMGTVVVSEPSMSSAIIAEANGRNEQLYREGESVKGAKIKKILRNAVVVNTGKRDEVLKMDTGKQGTGKKSDAQPASSKRAIPDQVVTLDPDQVEKSLKDIPALLESARFARYTSGGIEGGQVRSMAKGSAFAALGLRSNDIILGANGEPFTNIGQATALYEELSRGGHVALNIKRFGRDRDIALRLK
jgi:general secretion pathway protein C